MSKVDKHKKAFQEEVAKRLDSMKLSELLRKQMKTHEMMEHPLWTQPPQSVGDSYRFGWMRGIALMTDTMLEGRWYEWLRINNCGEMKDPEEMPRSSIRSESTTNSDGRKMLERCMKHVYASGYRITDFIEWIGYSLGIAWFEKPRIPDRLWENLYREFNLDILQMKPADYFSSFVGEHGQSGHLDYFPTPIQITVAINQMLNAKRTDSQFEPCIGAAAMVLPSDSLNLVGADLSLTMVKVASIQAFLYMPSMLYVPRPVVGVHADPSTLTINKYFEFDTDTRIYCGNSLLGEYQVPKNIFEEKSEKVDIFCHAADLTKHDIFNYEEHMLQPWDSIPYELKVEIVKAQAREILWDCATTNPPFNASLSKHEAAIVRELQNSNRIFMEERNKRLEALLWNLNPIMDNIIQHIELKMSELKDKKVIEGQLELVI